MKLIRSLEQLAAKAARAAWPAVKYFNEKFERPSVQPRWAPAPLLKRRERTFPQLGWPRTTDSLCPRCVKEVRTAIFDGTRAFSELIEGKPGEIPAQIVEDYVDDRTPQEIDEQRFSWTDDRFAERVAGTTKGHGVILFYADDQYYDLAKLRAFIEQGRDRLAKAAKLKPSQIEVTFGGYRMGVEVEYFIIPKNGKPPTPTPEERKAMDETTDPEPGSLDDPR